MVAFACGDIAVVAADDIVIIWIDTRVHVVGTVVRGLLVGFSCMVWLGIQVF